MSKKSFTCGNCGKHHLKSRTCVEQKEISDAKLKESILIIKKLDALRSEPGKIFKTRRGAINHIKKLMLNGAAFKNVASK